MDIIAQALATAGGHLAAGQLAEAEAIGRRILMQGEHPGAFHLLAVVAERRGHANEAFRLIDCAARLVPDHAVLCHQRAIMLRKLDRLDEAADAFRHLLVLDPAHVDGHAQLGISLNILGDPAGAEAAFRRAVVLSPADPGLHGNLGAVRRSRGDPRAEVHTRIALALHPSSADAFFNLGVARMKAGFAIEASRIYRRAITVHPDFVEAHWNLSWALLSLGAFTKGWREYEWRWRRPETPPRPFQQPQWQGEDITGKTILLHAEQGHGDVLQFVRYAPLVAARGARVLLECHPALLRLFAETPGLSLAAVYPIGGAPPVFDVHCPLMSLPIAFGSTLETLPAKVPYLRTVPALATAWRERLAGEQQLKVGLVWAGEPRPSDRAAHAVDRRRSITLAALAPLSRVGGVAFFSLQKGPAAVETQHPPAGLRLVDFMPLVSDFADTAGLVEQLDLVVAVDTAVAHLAGAMGKPVWVLSRFDGCWRWLKDRDDSPWYPTLRLFRQDRPDSWGEVIERVALALEERAAAGRR